MRLRRRHIRSMRSAWQGRSAGLAPPAQPAPPAEQPSLPPAARPAVRECRAAAARLAAAFAADTVRCLPAFWCQVHAGFLPPCRKSSDYVIIRFIPGEPEWDKLRDRQHFNASPERVPAQQSKLSLKHDIRLSGMLQSVCSHGCRGQL